MTKMIITADADSLVTDAVKLLAAEEVGSLIVTKGDVLAGIVTRGDIIGAQLLSRESYEELTLADIMTSPVVTVSPDIDLGQIISVLSLSGKGHIPVVEGDAIIGLITAADVIRVLATLKLVAKAVPDDDEDDDYAGE